MVMVSNLPTLPDPVAAETDVAIVSRNNQLFKISLDDLFAAGSINVDESTVDHNLLLNYNALEHIDWTNASETLVTTGQVLASNISGINTGDQNLFSTFSVLGLTALDDIVATETADTFTFVPGPNIAITTNPATKELFISAGGATGNLPLNIVEDNFTYPADYDGTVDTLTLTVDPDNSDKVFVFFDGVYQNFERYSVGSPHFPFQINFEANIPTSVKKVDVITIDEVDLYPYVARLNRLTGDFNTGDTAITIGTIPDSSDKLLIFFEGAFQGSNTYNLSGSTVTFTSPIPSGIDEITYVDLADTGSNILEVSIGRQVYIDGVNYTGGLTDLLPLPNPVQSAVDVLVFFDSLHIGSDKYSVNGTLIDFNAPIPTYVSKVEIITISGGEGISSLSFGRIDVPSQSSIVADTVSDTFTLIPGTNIDILTNPLTSEITINNTQTIPPAFDAIVADSGGNLNAGTSSTVNILGGTEIDVTSDGVDTLTVTFTGTLGDPDQNLWETITADSGFTTADTINDNLTVAGGTLINTSITGDTLTIDFTGAVGDPDQNIFDRVQIDGVDSFLAGSTTDPINFEQGANILISNPSPNTLRFDTGGALGESNTSSSVNAVTGQSLVLPKVGVDLPFKGIDTTDPNVSVTSNATDVLVGLNIPTLEGNLNHDNLAGFVADEHIDWTSATQNLSTTGTISGSNLSGTNTGDQNLWATVNADVGTTTANILADTITIAGGTNVTTTIVGDVLTIDAVGAGGDPDQNLWETINADVGTTTANTTTDTLTIAGGTNVTTTIVGDTLTIDAVGGGGDPDQNLWETFIADVGTTTANTITDTLTVAGGTNIDTNITGDTLTINFNGVLGDPDQNLWETFTADTGSTTANTITDTLTVTGGTNMSTSIAGDILTINTTATPDQNLWETITADVGAPLTPNITTDTLNFVGGTNITITSDGVDTLTIDSTGGGGGVSLQGVQVFTASGTWNRPVGITLVRVKVVGGGGGGGGANASAGGGGTRVASAGGGAAGGYAEEIIDVSATASASVTVGTGGAAGSGAAGGDGGNGLASSFDAFCSATGGVGGLGTGTGAADGTSTLGGRTPGSGIGGDVNLTGTAGGSARSSTANNAGGGLGGPSPYGNGGASGGYEDAITSLAALNGTSGGGGGGGASRGGSAGPGGLGGDGIVVVYEYG